MQIIFLGTSAGTPTRSRNVSACAFHLRTQREWFLVDCGEGTQHQLLDAPLSLRTLEAVCITHVHGDHMFGLPGLLSSAQLAGRRNPLKILAPHGVREFVETALRCSDSYVTFPLEWVDITPDTPPQAFSGLEICSVPLSHRVPSYAYCFTESPHARRLDKSRLLAAGVPAGPELARLHHGDWVTLADGRTIHGEDFLLPPRIQRRVIISGDNDRPDLLAAACASAQVLVHEATYTQEVADRVGDIPRHSAAAQIAGFAESAGLPNLVLTHFSARYADRAEGKGSIEEIRLEAATHYHGRLFLARDHVCHTLDADGILHAGGTPEP